MVNFCSSPITSCVTLTVNFCLSPITSCVIFFGADHGAFVLDGATAHHAAYRAQLVEWILDVCAGERYGPTPADVAIGYMVRGRCDATRSTVSPPGWLIPAWGDLIFAATDRDVRTNGEKNKTSETIRNARTRAMGTMAND